MKFESVIKPLPGDKAYIPLHAFGTILLEVGVSLLRSGASTKRVRINMKRLAAAYGYRPDIHIEPRSISLSLRGPDQQDVFTGTRIAPAQIINFKIISGISRMSWSVTEKQWSEMDLWRELNRLLSLPDYPRLIVLLVVGLAGSAFCYAYGGSSAEMAITFGATFCGLWIKQELMSRFFNPYLVTYLSALIAGFFTTLFLFVDKSMELDHAFTTSFLFLIPGVPLINSFSDLMDGEILNGIDRGVNALMHAMAIALGLSTLVFLFKIHP